MKNRQPTGHAVRTRLPAIRLAAESWRRRVVSVLAACFLGVAMATAAEKPPSDPIVGKQKAPTLRIRFQPPEADAISQQPAPLAEPREKGNLTGEPKGEPKSQSEPSVVPPPSGNSSRRVRQPATAIPLPKSTAEPIPSVVTPQESPPEPSTVQPQANAPAAGDTTDLAKPSANRLDSEFTLPPRDSGASPAGAVPPEQTFENPLRSGTGDPTDDDSLRKPVDLPAKPSPDSVPHADTAAPDRPESVPVDAPHRDGTQVAAGGDLPASTTANRQAGEVQPSTEQARSLFRLLQIVGIRPPATFVTTVNLLTPQDRGGDFPTTDPPRDAANDAKNAAEQPLDSKPSLAGNDPARPSPTLREETNGSAPSTQPESVGSATPSSGLKSIIVARRERVDGSPTVATGVAEAAELTTPIESPTEKAPAQLVATSAPEPERTEAENSAQEGVQFVVSDRPPGEDRPKSEPDRGAAPSGPTPSATKLEGLAEKKPTTSPASNSRSVPSPMPAPPPSSRTSKPIPEDAPLDTSTLVSDRRLRVSEQESRLLRTGFPVLRAESLDTTICDVIQFNENEVVVIGKQRGVTRVEFWTKAGGKERTYYLVAVGPDHAEEERTLDQYAKLRSAIEALYPNSDLVLTPEKNRLVVSGTAKNSQEAIAIITMIRRMRSIPVVDKLRVLER